MRKVVLGLLFVGLWLPGAPHAAPAAEFADQRHAAPDAAALADFSAQVEAVRERFEVPGIAVAIVKDGEVVLARGWGVREAGKPEAVDADTMFAIASLTKAFTATALEMLDEDGKLGMNDRVIDHLPWFRMADPYVTHDMRIRDLLAHRSGLSLGAGDLLYWPTTDYTTREVVERLKDVPLSGQFRGQYAYDNILFAVAQLVLEEAAEMSFKQFLQQRIFQPLGMRDTRYNADDLVPGDNVATGHAKLDFSELKPVGTLTWRNASGAGGLYSSVNDMARWMRMQLAGGLAADGTRLFETRRQQRMWSVLTPIPVTPPAVPELAPMTPNFLGYGEGWMLSDYRGDKLVWHTGGWPGMVSRLTLVPERGIGVVVLTNQEVGAAFHSLTHVALDMMLGHERHDWVDAYAKAVARNEARADDSWQKLLAARDARSKPSLPLARYAGRYRDPWYGEVVISQSGNRLRMQFARTRELAGTLEHWQHDSFIVRWDDRALNADAFVYFALEPDGRIGEMRMKPVSPRTDFSFDFQDLRLRPLPNDAKAN
ncbi:serine hydrolase [Luteimonas sp. e5]